ncbi:MAG: GTP-binding protein [Clostridia bacterium]|nr:GTP-binding protein [Clostridia bacterium]
MTKIDIFSGFLGAGKTTLIKKLIAEGYKGEKLVLIENEFGEIGIDGGFLQEAGINITEMNSGCICCSLVGDFGKALIKVLHDYHPDRILIEPSGVGKLSDVIRAVKELDSDEIELSAFVTVVDAAKCKMYMKNFGEFFNDQVESAGTIILSHTGKLTDAKIAAAVELLREHNKDAVIVTTDWDSLTGEQLLAAMERTDTLDAAIEELKNEETCPVCGHHHHEHHHEHGEHCHHDHEHHHEHDEHCHHDHEHHHEHDEHCHHDHEHHHEHGECCHHDHEHHHEHHHDHGEHCSCGCHDHHHHHDADEVFVSCGAETAKSFTADGIKQALDALCTDTKYGMVLRAKGIVAGADGKWLHFDYVPGEPDVREGAAGIIGRLCVIGSKLDITALSALFGVELK